MSGLFEDKKQRKNFAQKTKKTEWLSASKDFEAFNQYIKFNKFDETVVSYCRECNTSLVWKSGKYEFDHKNNQNYNNSQNNCYLLCRNCHGEHTKIDKIKINKPFGTEYKTIKRKVGYKKSSVKLKDDLENAKKPKKKTLKPSDADWWLT